MAVGRLTPKPHRPGEVRPAKYPNPYAAPPPAELETDTGELRWSHADQKRGVITVNSPRTQSLIGFVRGSGESTPHLAADVTNDFCVLKYLGHEMLPAGASPGTDYHRDLAAFQDDDGTAYVVSSHDQHKPHRNIMITRLKPDYLKVDRPVCEIPLTGEAREAPYIIKLKSRYWLFVSGHGVGGSPWNGSPTSYTTAEKLEGPWTPFKVVECEPASKDCFNARPTSFSRCEELGILRAVGRGSVVATDQAGHRQECLAAASMERRPAALEMVFDLERGCGGGNMDGGSDGTGNSANRYHATSDSTDGGRSRCPRRLVHCSAHAENRG